MSARPVLFNGAMVRAILAGAKTQTRRVVKPQPPEHVVRLRQWYQRPAEWVDADGSNYSARCPLGAPGDDLWVRETWAEHEPDDVQGTRVYYRADHAGGEAQVRPGMFLRWTPSIHMPRWASRLTLRVTSVRVERLHAISEDDARAEGVQTLDPRTSAASARECFADLWSEISGRESWDANPWVWVVSFERNGGGS